MGSTLGPCRLDALVGAGGMGRVYRGVHLALQRRVAVKIIDRTPAGAPRDAALAEARAAAKLEDPRIVAVYDVGEDRGLGYIVFQWIDGENLETLVRRSGPLTPERALGVMREIAAALAAAHRAGVVHRDVKPANILIDARGAARLTDFGLAGAAGRVQDGGEGVGSAHFMAPEQGWGAPPDPRMDVYALGGTWYFALTGSAPFPGDAARAVEGHRDSPPPDARELRPELSARAAALIVRLLDKDPARRPADGERLSAELADPGLLLDVDASGSPLRLLAAKPASAPRSGLASAPPARAPAPAAPPAPRVTELGSPAAFRAILAALVVLLAGWPWLRAVREDWLAAAFVGQCAPLLLGLGARRGGARRALGAAAWVGSWACAARFAWTPQASPSLETLMCAGFALVAGGGAVYLAYWGQDREELWWARALAPAGAVLLAAAALTWSAGFDAAAAEAARAWRALEQSDGGWRWLGFVAAAAAWGSASGLRTRASRARRAVNWSA